MLLLEELVCQFSTPLILEKVFGSQVSSWPFGKDCLVIQNDVFCFVDRVIHVNKYTFAFNFASELPILSHSAIPS